MAIDKIKPLGLEDSIDGTEVFPTPTELDPDSDYAAVKGIAFENSDNTTIEGDSGVMKFKDTDVTVVASLIDLVEKIKRKEVDLSLLTQGYILIYNQSLDKFELKPPLGGIASGVVAGTSFAGSPQKKVTITFTNPFPDNNYNVTITGENARTFTIESKGASSFVINANANVAFTGNVFWQAIKNGQVV
ncbi:MAG: hypothetical protein HC836_47735 [Richelia sp. RM2_1_2]|nr:hypothetical protein [Richelia sp. RM2_1_2]